MRYRLTFITGLAVGYVLGTRAGRERYEQLRTCARQFVENPAVRNTAETAALGGRKAATKAFERVKPLRERIGQRGKAAEGEDDWGTSNT